MADRPPNKKSPSGAQASRDDRLKAALKANMARRKAQMRARSGQSRADEADRAEKADAKDKE